MTGKTVEVSELVKRMDAMKPEIRTCPMCPATIDLDMWRMLTGDEKWSKRHALNFQVKRQYNTEGHVKYSLETLCKKCRNKKSRVGRPKVERVVEHGPGSPMFRFLYGRKCAT